MGGSGEVVTRPATRGDVEEIADVHVDGWRTRLEPLATSGLTSEEYAQGIREAWASFDFEDFRQGPKGVLLVAEVGGRLVGYVGAHFEEDGTPHVYSVFVRAAFQSRGIGQALLAALAEELVARGHDRVVGYSQVGNTRTSDLYEWLGAEPGPVEVHPSFGGKAEHRRFEVRDLPKVLARMRARLTSR